MQYIVLDLEWNQPWPGSYAAKKVLPVEIHGEIIQIGAVRILENGTVGDEFQVLVRPKYYKKLNSRVSKLTGIRDIDLRDSGLPFPEALAKFREWIGGECIFLTWGFDDITLLEDNILLHDDEPDWITQWYNVQMIFNSQLGCDSSQKALATAMGMMNIEPSRQAHDALGDAYHTALICSRLDLVRGIDEYAESLRHHEDGFHGAPPEGCISKVVFRGYEDKAMAMQAMTDLKSHCPQCGREMPNSTWLAQETRRYMTMANCPEHGRFLIRIRLLKDDDGTLRVSRMVYEGACDAAKKFDELSQRRKQHRRRRRQSFGDKS